MSAKDNRREVSGLNPTIMEQLEMTGELPGPVVRALLEQSDWTERPTPTRLTIMGDDSEYHGPSLIDRLNALPRWVKWPIIFIASGLVAYPVWRILLGM